MPEQSEIPIDGYIAPGFELVRDAFAANFASTAPVPELGASFCLIVEGETVADLWGGFADPGRTRPWRHDTVVTTMSTTKGIASTCIAVAEHRGLIDYEAPVARYWPEFAQNGKGGITVELLLSHQAGLSGLREPLHFEDLFDWDAMVVRLAAAEPLWMPGTMAGYHALTWGFLAGELIRRTDGRSLGTFLREEVAGPLGAEYYIGLPESVEPRVAEMLPPRGEPTQSLAEMSEILRLTLLNPHVEPSVANRRDFRAAELPAFNGNGSANGVARIYAPFALGGSFDGNDLISPETIARAARHRFRGIDINTGVEARWGAGFFGNNPKHWYGPNEEAFGHSGWGGSMGFADPVARLAVGYVPNQMDANLHGDPRGLALVDAVYQSIEDR